MRKQSSIRNQNVFIGLSLMLVIALGLALVYIPKGELHLLLCDRHTPARDIFYRYYTHVAEWFPYIVCVALLLFSRIGDGAFASAAMLGSALTTQLFKHIFVAPRPFTWFAEQMPHIQLPLVDGVTMNHWFSFPSGHTTSFFSLAFVLSIIATRYFSGKQSNSQSEKGWYSFLAITVQLLLFVAAALGGYSRIYLCQHFALDVFAGVVVGVGITIICLAIFNRYMDKNWYNYRLITKK